MRGTESERMVVHPRSAITTAFRSQRAKITDEGMAARSGGIARGFQRAEKKVSVSVSYEAHCSGLALQQWTPGTGPPQLGGAVTRTCPNFFLKSIFGKKKQHCIQVNIARSRSMVSFLDPTGGLFPPLQPVIARRFMKCVITPKSDQPVVIRDQMDQCERLKRAELTLEPAFE